MRRHASVAKRFGIALALLAGGAQAGGPLFIDGTGTPFLWGTAAPIGYRTDNGPLSSIVNEAAARSRVLAMFNVWQNVPTSNIRYSRLGSINSVGAFTDGDVSTAAEYNAVEGACINGVQSPIVYDVNGTLFEDLGMDPSVIGFAGPCAVNASNQIISGQAVMNGIYQDGIDAGDNFELTTAQFDAAFIHEFGHFSGLDHSQINLGCLFGACGDDLNGLPTMFPFLVDQAQGSLATDDVGWISRLYPDPAAGTGFNATHGTITGVVYFSDGESHAQLVNVIARRVDTGAGESRRFPVSVVSGYRFGVFHGNPITGAQSAGVGSDNPAHIGLFEIPVPAGNYLLEVESIYFDFVDGSSVGPEFLIAMPGNAPGLTGPITVAAGATVSGVNIVLNGTPPRFDQFESP